MSTPTPSASAGRPSQLAVEFLPIAVLLGLLLWGVRDVVTPLVVFPLLLYALWPTRVSVLGRRTLVVASVIFALWFVSEIRVVLMPFVLAFAVAYLLAPAVEVLVRRRVPRPVAIPIVFLPFLGLIVTLALILIPEMERQLLDLVAQIPALIRRVVDWALALRTRLVATGGAGFLSEAQLQRLESLQASDLVSMVSGKWDAISQHLSSAAFGIGRGVGVGLTVVLTVFGYVIVAPIVVFYLLQVWPNLMPQIKELVPPAERPAVFKFLHEYDHVLSRFVRGQLTESMLVATLTGVSLGLLGFRGALLMAVIAGVCNLIPTVGTFLGLIPGILIALTAPEVGPALLKLGGVYAVVQIMDGQITGPLIVGGSIGLSPVWSMIAVLVLGALFGLVGMFLSMPLAGLAKMIVMRAVARYEASPMYTGKPVAPSG
jgi:predicted PurR-regulated permease PerM